MNYCKLIGMYVSTCFFYITFFFVTANSTVLPAWWSFAVSCRCPVPLHHRPIRYSLLYQVMYFVFVTIQCFVYGCHCSNQYWCYLNSLHVMNSEWWNTFNFNVLKNIFLIFRDICLYHGRGICHKIATGLDIYIYIYMLRPKYEFAHWAF
jgi:hypothetical protein